MAENYLQHAEHYYRLIMAYQAHLQQQQGQQGQQHGQPYGAGQQAQGQPQSQAGHYGGPYRNQPANANPDGNVSAYDQAPANGNGNVHGEAVVTSSASSTPDEDYSEENNGRYD
jgi:hypothetical protein